MSVIGKKKKRILGALLSIISFPLSIATAGGGGIMGFLFAAILAIGVDMLFDK